MVWAGLLPITPTKLPEALKRKAKSRRNRVHKKHYGKAFPTARRLPGCACSEFADFAKVSAWGTEIYFAHPYTSWERAQNERHSGLFRAFVPKGASIEQYSTEEILSAADELNGRPRKKLGYHTPEELFLDFVFAA